VVGAFLLLLAFPIVVSAASAITSFSMDRATINQGQSVTFSLTTTSEVNYVFADVDGVRVQGTLQSANTWRLVASPSRTGNIIINANATNNETGAATVSIPITVNAATVTTPPTTPITPGVGPPITIMQGVSRPDTPAVTTGPLAIHSITETPAIRANYIQLTVVAGVGANEVWVQFDDGRFRRGQEQTALRTETTRTWVINFRPERWAVQTVQVSANREYVFAGATTQNHVLTLAEPFVAPVVPTIQGVSPSTRNVLPGGSTTFTIRTNLDVNYVWIIDVDGNRRNATASGRPTATTRTWTVTFSPTRTGSVTVYANTANNTTGAVTSTEHITAQQQNASFVGTPTARWSHDWWTAGWQNVTVEVTTNQFAEHVWVQLPNGNTHALNRISGTGTTDRTWRAEISSVGNISTLQVHISDVSGSWTSRDSRSVSITGQQHMGNAWISMPSGSWVTSAHASHTTSGNQLTITFTTDAVLNHWHGGIWVTISGFSSQMATTSNGIHWTVTFPGMWFDNLHSRTITFNDHTGSGRVVTSGTLSWH